MSITVLLYLLVVFIAAFIGGATLKALKQPPVVGYILAGFILSVFIGDSGSETIKFLADLGIVLLLFTLGLEFSFARLKRVAHIAVFGGIIQILATLVIGMFILAQLGFSFYSALFMAAAFSLSSTAIVVKILTDRGQMDSLPGEIMVGWLVIQDLAVLPMMILLPTLGRELFKSSSTFSTHINIGRDLAFAVIILTVIMILGKKAIPWLIGKISGLNSRELLLVAVFAIAITSAMVTQALGLSAALGAFLAGLLIAESTQQHAVFAEIRPLKDIFSLLFFATLGLILPGGFLFAHFGMIISITVIIILIKFILVLMLTIYFGYQVKTSFIVGMGLINVGEFAFILARVGLNEGVIDTTTYGMILSVGLLSILIMPPLFLAAPQLYVRLRETTRQKLPDLYFRFFAHYEHRQTLEELPFKDHVVLCGYGRVGRYIGRALEMAKIPFVVIEYNQHLVSKLRKEGITVVYGDPSDRDILDFAQVDYARAVIVTIPDLHTQKMVVAESHKLNKHVQILCRTHHEENQQLLKDLGVDAIIQPEFEASLSITNKILKLFGQKEAEIEGKISRLKIEHGLG